MDNDLKWKTRNYQKGIMKMMDKIDIDSEAGEMAMGAVGRLSDKVHTVVFSPAFEKALKESTFFKPHSLGATQMLKDHVDLVMSLKTAKNFGQITQETYDKVICVNKQEPTQGEIRDVKRAMKAISSHHKQTKMWSKSFLSVQIQAMLADPNSLYWRNHRKAEQSRVATGREAYGAKY